MLLLMAMDVVGAVFVSFSVVPTRIVEMRLKTSPNARAAMKIERERR
jgi:hypothetical protein